MGIFHPKYRTEKTHSEVGAQNEQFLAARLMFVGYNVLKPLSVLRYDYVIEDAEGKFWRVQCKTGRYRKDVRGREPIERIEFHCKSRRSYRGDCDYIAVYCGELHTAYLVPVRQLPEQLGSLRLSPPMRKGDLKGTLYAADYEL